jgi:dihydroxyacetone kinase
VKHFINDRNDIVTEALDAAVLLGEGKLARLDGYPAIKVLLRTDGDRTQVALVSGGGAGHEPAHVGFVGEGMLTAAVCGEIFASPSVDAVLAGILAATGDAGCLLIVKNYTGDRLNFGLAAERARALGVDVEMVVVGDDIAIADATRPRGLAGTLFVHKVAGHVARSGGTLREVKAAAERVASNVRSLGISLSSCTIPGQPVEARLNADEVELGLGIHGEPGAEKIAYRPIAELAATMAKRLDDALGDTKLPIALLVNDLGGVPPIEMAVATRALVSALKREIALVLGPDRLMTSLDMKGLSVSVLPVDEELMRALLSDVAPRAWSRGRALANVAPLPLPSQLRPKTYVASANAGCRRVVETACRTLLALEAELNALDAKVGDGDTGSTFATASRAILADLDRLPFGDPPALCASVAERLSTVMGGSSGILLSIGVAAMGAAVKEAASKNAAAPDAIDWAKALHEGVRRIQQYGGAAPGDRTMLDALFPAATALEAGEGLAAAATAARRGAELTASMTRAGAGRSSYVPAEALRGVPDPGAVAMAAVFEAIGG